MLFNIIKTPKFSTIGSSSDLPVQAQARWAKHLMLSQKFKVCNPNISFGREDP